MPNEQADANVVVKPSESWLNQEDEVLKGVESIIGGEKLDAVLCVAGGWAGGNAASKGMTTPPPPLKKKINLFNVAYYYFLIKVDR